MYNNLKTNLTSAVFVVSVTFGIAFSNEYLPSYWWQGNILKRIIMGGIAVACYLGTFLGFRMFCFECRPHSF
jgi:hypothetical protein